MKTLLTRAWLPALLLAVAFLLAACGSAGGGQGSGTAGHGDHGKANESGRMDHSNMGHGSMGMGSGAMARQMVVENGRYSDKAFIDAMVPHHQGAVEMAEVALQNAEHEEIKQLSRNIISTQQAEIEELKAIKQQEFGTSRVPMEMSAHEMQMMGMTDPDALANKNPFDMAFIDAMIPHHQSAIVMAQVALEESDNPEIKELAENIVSAQQREIEQMLQWRQAWYPEG
jgi:uncharacterized protein (DUF305 family)/predicted small secreted protein